MSINVSKTNKGSSKIQFGKSDPKVESKVESKVGPQKSNPPKVEPQKSNSKVESKVEPQKSNPQIEPPKSNPKVEPPELFDDKYWDFKVRIESILKFMDYRGHKVVADNKLMDEFVYEKCVQFYSKDVPNNKNEAYKIIRNQVNDHVFRYFNTIDSPLKDVEPSREMLNFVTGHFVDVGEASGDRCTENKYKNNGYICIKRSSDAERMPTLSSKHKDAYVIETFGVDDHINDSEMLGFEYSQNVIRHMKILSAAFECQFEELGDNHFKGDIDDMLELLDFVTSIPCKD